MDQTLVDAIISGDEGDLPNDPEEWILVDGPGKVQGAAQARYLRSEDDGRESVKKREERDERDEERRKYKYTELPSTDHIRLLCLLPGKFNDPIHCQLRPSNIDSTVPYRAVSYTWGDDIPSQTILCDNGRGNYDEFRVRLNLHDLLKHLRHVTQHRLLWIDAICIDQKSPLERNHQVKLMGRIYNGASSVLAWLGTADKEIEGAFELIRDCAKVGLTRNGAAWNKGIAWGKGVGNETERDYYWRCLKTLTKVRYWNRTWIIQEIVLATSVDLQAGNETLPMKYVEELFGELTAFTTYPYVLDTQRAFWNAYIVPLHLELSAMARLARHRLEKRSGNAPSTLSNLMLQYEHSESTEPCDKAYGFYNLIKENRTFLSVDYNQTVADRCLTVLQFMLRHENIARTDIMRIVSLTSKQLGMSDAVVEGNILRGEGQVSVTAVECGELMPDNQSSETIAVRKRTPVLRVMPVWSLRKVDEHWSLQKRDPTEADIIPGFDTIDPDALCCFREQENRFIGLATNKVCKGDRLWMFEGTTFGLVVRKMKAEEQGTAHEIVSRAVLFNSKGQQVSVIEELRKSVKLSSCPHHDIVLTYAAVFELAFWADCCSTRASPFT